MATVVARGDMADMAIEDLRRWKWWDLTKSRLWDSTTSRPTRAPLVKNAILRYASDLSRRRRGRFVKAVASDRARPAVREVREVAGIRAAQPRRNHDRLPDPLHPIHRPAGRRRSRLAGRRRRHRTASRSPKSRSSTGGSTGQIATGCARPGTSPASRSNWCTLLNPRVSSATAGSASGSGRSPRVTRSTIHDAFAAALRSITGRKFWPVSRSSFRPPEQPIARPCSRRGVGAIQGSLRPGRAQDTSRHDFAPTRSYWSATTSRTTLLERVRRRRSGRLTLARELVNLPPCDLYPETFAARAAEVVGNSSAKSGTSAGWKPSAWGRSSASPAAPTGRRGWSSCATAAAATAPTLGLVGKGVTFDSGGLSLKTTEQMVDMKCDMAGAAAVLAAIAAVAELKLPVNLLGVMALVENMPGGRAMKLGDVLHARNGKTIEVLNTDAEGRLILADALAYAVEQKAEPPRRPGHADRGVHGRPGDRGRRPDDATTTAWGEPRAGGGAAGRRAGLAAADGRGLRRDDQEQRGRHEERAAGPLRRRDRRRQVPGAVRRRASPGSTSTSPARPGPTTKARPATPAAPALRPHWWSWLPPTLRPIAECKWVPKSTKGDRKKLAILATLISAARTRSRSLTR